MNRWKEFLYSQKKLLKRNFIKGMPMPGPIDNKLLLGPANVLKPGMKRNIHFRIVNDYIWQILKQLYGGGPALVINDFNSRKRNYQKVRKENTLSPSLISCASTAESASLGRGVDSRNAAAY